MTTEHAGHSPSCNHGTKPPSSSAKMAVVFIVGLMIGLLGGAFGSPFLESKFGSGGGSVTNESVKNRRPATDAERAKEPPVPPPTVDPNPRPPERPTTPESSAPAPSQTPPAETPKGS